MTQTAPFVRALDHSIAAIHGDHKPNLAQLISAASEADSVMSALYNTTDSTEDSIMLAEDRAWEAAKALRAHLESIGVGPELQYKLGRLL